VHVQRVAIKPFADASSRQITELAHRANSQPTTHRGEIVTTERAERKRSYKIHGAAHRHHEVSASGGFTGEESISNTEIWRYINTAYNGLSNNVQYRLFTTKKTTGAANG
jgi:hypothetical protein